MPRPLRALPGTGLLLALALAGCGAASTTPTATFPTIPLQSPALKTAALPSRYTCDGKDVWPPLEWGEVPAGTTELAIFLINPAAVATAANTAPAAAEWAIAGVNPALHRIGSGEVPPGAYVGSNGNGKGRYSVCPARGESKNYVFAVYSLRPSLKPGAKFLDNPLLRQIASGPSPTSATAGGTLAVTYARK